MSIGCPKSKWMGKWGRCILWTLDKAIDVATCTMWNINNVLKMRVLLFVRSWTQPPFDFSFESGRQTFSPFIPCQYLFGFSNNGEKERFFGLMFHFLLTCLICSTVRSSPFLSNCSLTRDSKLRMILPTGCFNFLSTKVLESGYNRDIWMVSSRGPINKRHKGQIKT